MRFREELPDNCPPEDAFEPENLIVYRMVETIPPTERDFYSHAIIYPDRKYKYKVSDCELRSVSVFAKINECKLPIKIPANRGRKIVRLILNVSSGKVRQGTTSHYSWWIYADFSPFTNYKEIT
jgi:hypothetical protein